MQLKAVLPDLHLSHTGHKNEGNGKGSGTETNTEHLDETLPEADIPAA